MNTHLAHDPHEAINISDDDARGGVIGGSSAGASIQGEYMPRGHPLGNTVMAAEGYERGFGFLPGCAIDQHFFARNRTADMTGLMKKYPQYLGIGIDAFHIFAAETSLDAIDDLQPDKIFLVQLADFMWQETKTFEERMTTARTFRVFPGEGVHSEQLVDLVLKLDALGYAGDYSFEVFNDDYQQLPLSTVAQRARRSAVWLAEDVLRRSTPLPNRLRLRGTA